MSVTRAELKEAFRQVASEEFSSIPLSDRGISYEFSASFLKRMQKLFRSQKKPYWKLVNTGFKRFAVAILAAVMLLASACSFKEVRDSILEFIGNVYETFAEFWFEGNTVDRTTKAYELASPPEGFWETERVKTPTMFFVEYTNEAGETIGILQMITDEAAIHFDIENGNMHREMIDGNEVIFFVSEKKQKAAYIKDGYCIEITWSAGVEIPQIKDIILKL